MTQENKEILLKDLCARLPYRVLVYQEETGDIEEVYCINKLQEGIYTRNCVHHNITTLCPIEDIKPCLRPMSSMTEEEFDEYESIKGWKKEYELIDWLNKKMFAYRTIDGKDMFELGLALEAPEGMYN